VLHRMDEYNDFLRAYLASISYADALFGKVLDRLEETGQIDNTIIVLWSDHGWQFGEKLASHYGSVPCGCLL
jgi:arylsulfatase A-like enzyme